MTAQESTPPETQTRNELLAAWGLKLPEEFNDEEGNHHDHAIKI